jgi:hypothetical protein
MYSPTLFLDLGSRRGEWSALRPGRIIPGTHLQEAGWAPGPAWIGAENLAPHRDSIPGHSSPQPVAIPTELPGPKHVGATIRN